MSEPPTPLALAPTFAAVARDANVLDLLHERPLVRGDEEKLRHALRFAYETGDAAGVFRRCVDDAPIAKSQWKAGDFARSLFLSDFLKHCFRLEVDGQEHRPSQSFLARVLSHPPNARADVTLRQHVLTELSENPQIRESLTELYAHLRHVRALLDERAVAPGETVRRKVELLQLLKDILDLSVDGFEESRSALRRLHTYAKPVRESRVYESLTDVLDYEAHMATVDVRLQLSADGRIREFAMIRAEENAKNPILPSPWRRFWRRVIGFMRGYRFYEYEVLLKVLDRVFEELEDFLLPFFPVIGDIELYLASMSFRDLCESKGLHVSLAELVDAPAKTEPDVDGPRMLKGLFNPLLLLQDIIPETCDLTLTSHDRLVVVTGPNSGGKTRLLQALGLTQALGQAGLFVPAARASLTWAPTAFVSLGEPIEAEQQEGRLGSELIRIRHLFEQLQPGSLVILDELCSGTNPSEGVAIFELVISLLPQLRAQVFVTTHFLDAAKELQANPPVDELTFLQVELGEHQKPTYQFVPGVAGTSLAYQVASRLGVTREELEEIVATQVAQWGVRSE